jgi:voltage-gated potassium channel
MTGVNNSSANIIFNKYGSPGLADVKYQPVVWYCVSRLKCIIGVVMKKRTNISLRSQKFIHDVLLHTPIVWMTLLLVVCWMLFSAGIYYGEQGAEGTSITSYGRALYWGIAAFSTAGIADMPINGVSEVIGALWIVFGSMLFFGTIVATITAYFMRPLLRPSKRIIETIEFNLEQLDDLSVDELELLKETTDSLIEHVERLKLKKQQASDSSAA